VVQNYDLSGVIDAAELRKRRTSFGEVRLVGTVEEHGGIWQCDLTDPVHDRMVFAVTAALIVFPS
jgi:hypothetical protein